MILAAQSGSPLQVIGALKTPEAIRAWLSSVLETKGLTTIVWADKAGVSRSTLFRALSPDYTFVTSRRTLTKLAAALEDLSGNGAATGSAPLALAGAEQVAASAGLGAPAAPGFLELRYEIQRGVWRDSSPDVPCFYNGPIPKVGRDDRYPGAQQWLELVRDDSADALVGPGAFVNVIDAAGIDYAPRQGDWVVAQRCRDAGLLERTVRQVDISQAGVRLLIRASNPRLGGAQDAKMTLDGATIAGLVAGAHRIF